MPALLVLVALAVLISLGNWQVRRLAWKENLIARAAERPLEAVRDVPPASAWPSLSVADGEYRPYRLRGRFLHEKEALVFTSLPQPKGAQGGPGYWIVTPFVLTDGGAVLVNRGFAPQGQQQPEDRGESRIEASRCPASPSPSSD
jgi:surfeit locus 1 family protein